MSDEVDDLKERLAKLERQAQRPSALGSVFRFIGKVIGWFILIPAAIVAAIGTLICSLGFLLVLAGKLSVLSYIGWWIITPITVGVVALGMMLAGVGHWAETEEA